MIEQNASPPYQGFEQGPIRPPSEAQSLLVRVTRNCHWNRCAFCPIYKGARFSIRPVDHVLRDLDSVARHVETLTLLSSGPGLLLEDDVREAFNALPAVETAPFRAAFSWFVSGMESVFLQDADSLVLRPAKLVVILSRLRELFPSVKRITSYSRSDTIARTSEDDLRALGEAGLNRIHIGMESGCDAVLAMMCKGATKELHVRAGLKVKAAGIELSEYYMPGLGGCELWREHAQDTADAMNRINPDFIRLRTLAVPERSPLAEEVRSGRFRKCPDSLTAEEILLFLDILEGGTGYLASDHILNLFPELEGRLPDDLPRMKDLVWEFLTMQPEARFIYQLGRRLGIMSRLADVADPARKSEVLEAARKYGVTPENLDETTDRIVRRFI
ncbi:MAG TPA: radical SAM protein [Geobacteraceae bacterium]|nr:radical SAM protein [Geobacteraceae bacterium]